MYSSTTLFSSTATGLRSLANASAPTRSASSAIEPPPANGSTTNGRVPAELRRTQLVGGIEPQGSADALPTRRQRPPRPPDVQRRNVPMPDRLLPPRMGRDAGNGQVHFDEPLRIRVHGCSHCISDRL